MINNTEILVSIIVPIYKVEAYLERCLDSIINQTYQNIEIICVDDGSPDKSGDIAERYATRDDRIHVVHKINEGLGFARNTGLELCSGDYVTFVDSDDYIETGFIKQLVEGVIRTNADTVIAGHSKKRNSNIVKIANPIAGSLYEGNSIVTNILYKMIGPLKINDSINMGVCRVLFSLDIIKRYKIRFPSERQFISEDIIFDLFYYPKAKKVCGISDCGYIYCLNSGSLTERYNPSRYQMGKILYFEEIRLLNTLNCTNEALLRAGEAFARYTRYAIKSEVKFSAINGRKICIQNIRIIISDKIIAETIRKYQPLLYSIDGLIDFGIKLGTARFIYIILRLGYEIRGEIHKDDIKRKN